MSGPNTEYDPVQVTPLNESEIESARDSALAAIAAAGGIGTALLVEAPV